MNQDKIDFYNYKCRKSDIDAADRLSKTSNQKFDELEEKTKDMNLKIDLSKLSNDSLKAIQQDICIRLSRFNIEAYAIKTEIKRIDRILKLRKVPLLDDID